MTEQKATNIHWHDGEVTREKRATLLGHRGATLWFTGLSGSGKSTVAVALEGVLHDMGVLCYRLDGDNVRFGINKNLGFSEEDRAENIRRVGEISKLFVDSGVLVCRALSHLICVIASWFVRSTRRREWRLLRYLSTVAWKLQSRETLKAFTKKARAGEIKNFTGIDDPYEAPTTPEIHLRTDQQTLEQEVAQIIEQLRERGLIAN